MLSVRPMQINDVPQFISYWYDADPDYLYNMGVDVNKMPAREQFHQMVLEQLSLPIEQRRSYNIIWEYDGLSIGHSNTNPTIYGEEGNMHLHIWLQSGRKKGRGTELVKLSVRHYFEKLKLKTLWCEPHALNSAPNKTLEKAGFKLVKEYVTVPGFVCYEQPVKQWKMSFKDFENLSEH
jgi:RimJ/RimL family protein N-acetyltransferase